MAMLVTLYVCSIIENVGVKNEHRNVSPGVGFEKNYWRQTDARSMAEPHKGIKGDVPESIKILTSFWGHDGGGAPGGNMDHSRSRPRMTGGPTRSMTKR